MQLSYEGVPGILRQFPHRHHSLGIPLVGRKWGSFVWHGSVAAQESQHPHGGECEHPKSEVERRPLDFSLKLTEPNPTLAKSASYHQWASPARANSEKASVIGRILIPVAVAM
jgi:hypothetical protein